MKLVGEEGKETRIVLFITQKKNKLSRFYTAERYAGSTRDEILMLTLGLNMKYAVQRKIGVTKSAFALGTRKKKT
jgi:hypothetical protein